MGEIAYRFLPCGEDGQPRENSQYTITSDERFEIGSLVKADILAYREWVVIETRRSRGPLITAKDPEGELLDFGGTLLCRAVR